jgi:hypothetical protein
MISNTPFASSIHVPKTRITLGECSLNVYPISLTPSWRIIIDTPSPFVERRIAREITIPLWCKFPRGNAQFDEYRVNDSPDTIIVEDTLIIIDERE